MKSIKMFLLMFTALNLSASVIARAEETAPAATETKSEVVRGKKDKKSCPHCKEEKGKKNHKKHGHDKHPNDQHDKAAGH